MRGRLPIQRVLLLALAVLILVVALVSFVAPSREVIAKRACRFNEDVCLASERFGVDGALIAAVIAVESKGEVDARSHKGALGLMQLMPATAKEVGDRLGVPIEEEEDVLEPGTNILLGTAYLKQQLDRFEGNESLALAAYNAGPRRVREWLNACPGATVEEALDRKAFPVTRAYVENVLAYRELIAVTEVERNRRR